MNDQKFVNAIYAELFEHNFLHYKEALTRPVDEQQDAFARARNALASLSDAQKMHVIDFFKVVMADSASVLLGVLDGVHFPNDLNGDIVLSLDGEPIQGDLQDRFIDKAQQDDVYG
ncbi:hypothetical protein IFR09_04625 [Pseudomonas syringae]|nr:hypothetical protein [Pseudomonas syringae]MBD8574182.1 hypothetical protein [Pseudomonas syringae]MBD8791679.1 hypothetical protein [Pseudomonas syringae]MBD8801039.1 hypothetical protein [Pseudomonas syringae]MBD8810443.1 hypothetical protein [Pseudomonas syringae]